MSPSQQNLLGFGVFLLIVFLLAAVRDCSVRQHVMFNACIAAGHDPMTCREVSFR